MIFLTLKLMRKAVIALCLVAGGFLLADSGWIYAKAELAQALIEDAWSQTLATGAVVKPWPWADTWPVARLEAGSHDVDLYVLQGTHGSSLAFGPGYLIGSATPGEDGSTIIAGHRDTHFRFMAQLQQGDLIKLTDRLGKQHQYLVNALHVVDSSKEQLLTDINHNQLVLVTCYPFDAITAGGPLRYVVHAALHETRRVM